jgi:cyclohexyl-isocyanide hydratase
MAPASLSEEDMTLRIGFLVFPHMQLLDLTGPYDVFAASPAFSLHLIARTLEPVVTTSGLALAFLRRRAPGLQYLSAVCTGSLLLGAAGLLRGRRATTHWAFHDLLELCGAVPVQERVVRDGTLITGGGVTAGVDFALTLVAEMLGETRAQAIQLELEYAPAPPFDAGRPERAPAAITAQLREATQPSLAKRRAILERVLAQAQARA